MCHNQKCQLIWSLIPKQWDTGAQLATLFHRHPFSAWRNRLSLVYFYFCLLLLSMCIKVVHLNFLTLYWYHGQGQRNSVWWYLWSPLKFLELLSCSHVVDWRSVQKIAWIWHCRQDWILNIYCCRELEGTHYWRNGKWNSTTYTPQERENLEFAFYLIQNLFASMNLNVCSYHFQFKVFLEAFQFLFNIHYWVQFKSNTGKWLK